MKLLMVLAAILVLAASPAIAGKNENGAMIAHTSDSYEYSGGAVCTAPEGDPGTCEDAVTQANREMGQVVWLLAAFPPSSVPGVTVVYFGIDYDDVNLDPGVNYRSCGPAGTIEIPDSDWPYGGRGNSVAFGSPIAGDTLFPFYTFKIDNYGGTAPGPYFCTTVNPIGGYAAFVDDSNPPLLDNCTRFGCVRWFEPGSADCPPDVVLGACCSIIGECQFLTPEDCFATCGAYMGDGVPCDPNPCPACWCGACCFPDGSCEVLLGDDCIAQGGEMSDCAVCVPDLCPVQIGACCFYNGECRVLTPEECYDACGSYLEDGLSCDPNPCPACWCGACCFPDGSCEVLLGDDCIAQGGEMAACAICKPDLCQAEIGACCFVDGTCSDLTEQECMELGNSVWFAGQTCADEPCPPTATESTTWGKIRATFR